MRCVSIGAGPVSCTGTTPVEPQVLIIGAGPTGLTPACELARRGVSFCLAEAGVGPQTGSRGKGLQPRTLEVFEHLGNAEGVLAHGRLAMPMRVTVTGGQGWKLAGVIQGASSDLLDTYEAERRPVAAGVLAMSDERLKQTLEQRSVPITCDVDTAQLGANYRGSSLVRDDRDSTASLRAGDRAPDATHLSTVRGEGRLFDLMKGAAFTVLNFATTDAARVLPADVNVLHVVEQPTGPHQLADDGSQLANAHGATSRTLVLIRPDGYIAMISDAGDASAIADYLAAVRAHSGHARLVSEPWMRRVPIED